MPLSLDDFDYTLPAELIAQFPARERSASRLLRLSDGNISDSRFADLPQFLQPGDLLVFNDTRVIKARLYGAKASGGKIEALVERITGMHEALVQMRASHPPRPGTRLTFDGMLEAEVLERRGDLYLLRFGGADGVPDLLERHGHLPLPPYIGHADSEQDQARYQTVYARHPGAVAAPTAGLHFDEDMLALLRKTRVDLAWLTLHVGAGTFQPVRVNNLAEHKMHSEYYTIPPATARAVASARASGHAVIAVGTTSLRALESAARADADCGPRSGAGETDLFITPGYRFQVVDRLITNFHLPKSTLLMLVAAFAGMEPMRAAYRHAIAERYRFFSYGDAMLIDKMP
ncbi:MAG: tRNA preQ1(34) S-adenosylmethionine ribosyltransferase-isomerase QueA [Burkholderiales bacterium]|nr:tRNA preQ1(34) S-adenosylmethionine ribosyltransferase-isomerase QueA [Burkholderiales bacterium]